MRSWRRKPQPECPCQCALLAQRLAEAEALNAAISRAVVSLRPRASNHTVAEGLRGWGVDQADAELLEAAYWRART